MRMKFIAKGVFLPLVATVGLIAGMSVAAAPAGAVNPLSVISGTVTDGTSGLPISGLCVALSPVGGGSFLDQTVTASDGTYVMAGMPEGEYNVFGACDGGTDGTDSVVYAGQFSPAVTVITGSATTQDLTMSLGGTISGAITTSSGTPLSNVCVSAIPSSPNSSEPGLGAGTASNGTYLIAGLSATNYAITVDPTCSGAVTSTYSSQSSQVEVTTESSTTENFTLTSTSTDTVTFNSDGGSPIAAASGSDGSSITLPSAPTYSGFTFDGWFTAAAGGLRVTSPYTLSSSITLYAQWTADVVTTSPPHPAVTDTVTFNLENGDAPEFMGAINGSNITLPSAPTFVGYTFDGWFTAPTGGSQVTSPYTLFASITFYAQWTADAVTTPPSPAKSPTPPTLRVVGAVYVGKTSTVRVVGKFASSPAKVVSNAPNTKVQVIRDPKSYLLMRITVGRKSPVGMHVLTVVLHDGGKLRAKYDAVRKAHTTPATTAPAVDITFNSDGGSQVASISGADGATIGLPDAPVYIGHTFDGWFAAPSGGTSLTSPYAIAGSVTLYAQWTPNEAPATFQGIESGNWSGYVLPVTGNDVTSVSGDWTVPTLDCAVTPDSTEAEWVGLNGASALLGSADAPLIQTGTMSSCSSGGEQENTGWWEIVPADSYSVVFSNLTVSAGDSMAAKVYESNGQWVTVVQDLTTGLQGTMVAGGTSFVSNIVTGAVVASYGDTAPYQYEGVTSAEWIVEAPTSDNSIMTLADFQTTSFSNLGVNTTSPMLTPQDAVEIVNQSGQALTLESPVSNGSFRETYAGS